MLLAAWEFSYPVNVIEGLRVRRDFGVPEQLERIWIWGFGGGTINTPP